MLTRAGGEVAEVERAGDAVIARAVSQASGARLFQRAKTVAADGLGRGRAARRLADDDGGIIRTKRQRLDLGIVGSAVTPDAG